MGALTDITAKANNTAKRSPNTPSTSASQALDSPNTDKNLTKGKSPRFMSPTLSSTQQAATKVSKAQDRNTTPSSLLSKKAQGSNWMASAAKRVGFRRGGDETPHARKAGIPSKAISFPDKLATPSYVKISDSPVSSPVQFLTTPPSEKPLPSPPIAQLAKTSPMKEARSLIDASEKPLRRSPPGMPHKQEEWPVLSPQKLTTTYPSQVMSHHGKLPASSSPNERCHDFDIGSPPAPLIGRKSATKLSPSHNIRRKQIPPAKPRDQVGPASKPSKAVVKSDNHRNLMTASGFAESSTTEPPNLSSSVVTTEKSAYEAASMGHPRQTRTSSLRARLSADQQKKDNSDVKTRAVGFIDLASVNKSPSKPSKDSLSVLGETGTRSQGALATNLLRAKSSTGSMHANRAPAQFVGGSRRPHSHRPSSRSSLRSDSRARVSSPTLQPPKRPAPVVPISSEVLDPETIAEAESSKTTESRRSSIPVFRHTASSINSPPAENEIASVNAKLENDSRLSDGPRNAFGMIEDHPTKPLPFNQNEEATDKPTGGKPSMASKNTMPYPSNLQAIEESPRQGYHIKRLSVASPENGPTLKISPDAERLIMGVSTDKESGSEYKPVKGKDLPDSFRTSDQHEKASGTGPVADLKKRLERPSSSQGFSYSASRFGLVSKESREKKVRSAELSNFLPTDRLHQHSAKPKTTHVRKSADISVDDDPFFDAYSTLGNDQAKVAASTALIKDPTSDEGKVTAEEASLISPLSDEHHDLSKGKAVFVVDSAPPTLQSQLSSGSFEDQKFPIVANSAKEAADIKQMPSEEMLRSNDNAENPLPSTPERSRDSNNSTSSSFPPRSSSRTSPPDYTVNESAKPSPTSPSERELPASKEFLLRHNQLGASKGHASSPVDISQGAGAKRDSAARDSTKTQNSISKGMLSNIRGLFHKRSTDYDPCSERSSKKFKPTTSIGPSGSPFPPISEIHPIHRPTLASNNRRVIKDYKPITVNTNIDTPATPSFVSPLPSEISATTTLAMQLLESARTERSSPKKERALELGTIMVEAITQARNAERAMEEAKQVARRAEVAYALCKKAVGDVSRRVLEWRDEFYE
ncbi:hypothetical protein MMC29_003737 [Sticta canariensis]|nr:hypothetical protein [Sticta canariensis]